MIRFASVIALLVLLAPPRTDAQTLVVGVRADAPPFSFHPDPDAPPDGPGRPRDLGYAGFMVDLCERVLSVVTAEHGLAVETALVDAGDRFDRLASGEVHVLCDPATILPDRLQGAMASVPVYMSAVTFAQPDSLPGTVECMTLVGYVGETTAAEGARAVYDRGGWPRYGGRIEEALDAMAGGDPSPKTDAGDGACDRERVRRFETHTELAERFCAEEVLFYVGDVEIIRAAIERQDACAVDHTVRPAIYSDERYAIYTALPQEGVPADALLLFLAELSRQVHGAGADATGSPLVRLYDDHRGTQEASEKLATFFWALTGSFPGQ